MSAPDQLQTEANQLSYGFLSSRAISTLGKIINNQPISDDEIEILINAHNFLINAANGALMITKGQFHGSNQSESINALRFAIDPLKNLEDILEDSEISTYFQYLADSMPIDGNEQYVDKEIDKDALDQTLKFFSYLYEEMANTLGKKLHKSHAFL